MLEVIKYQIITILDWSCESRINLGQTSEIYGFDKETIYIHCKLLVDIYYIMTLL